MSYYSLNSFSLINTDTLSRLYRFSSFLCAIKITFVKKKKNSEKGSSLKEKIFIWSKFFPLRKETEQI